jgi:hypothetical protein
MPQSLSAINQVNQSRQVIQRQLGSNGNGSTTADTGSASPTLTGATRLQQLLQSLDKLMAEKYAFDVFAANSINFGILITYRQTWEPLNYQTGDLVKTIPLAPKEVRRYTTKTVVKKTRSQKELEDSVQNLKQEREDTTRADAEIVKKSQDKTNFQMNSEESFGGDQTPWHIKMDQMNAGESAQQSEQKKTDFRQSVLKSAQEYKQEHKTEIEFTSSEETETTTFHEIQNPNDELTVTYLLYELQRTYRISEKIHALTPVVLVANEVPAPDEITDAWLVENGWILNRVILDDSYRPALQYLLNSFTGDEINISILEDNAILQQNIVRSLTQQLQTENEVVATGEAGVRDAILGVAGSQAGQGILNAIKSVFDPIGITGKTDTGIPTAAQTMLDYAKDSLDRADKERSRLLTQLQLAVTALQGAIDKLSAAVKDHYNQLEQIDRLRIHVKENILYYMQAIWHHEPPDQRYFRLYNKDVPMITADTAVGIVDLYAQELSKWEEETMRAQLPMPSVTFPTEKLYEVADLDNLVGYKGNYMIFPLIKNNYMTLHMMQDYLDVGDEVTVRDPDDFGNYTLAQLKELARNLYKYDQAAFNKVEDAIKQKIIDRLTSSRTESDIVIVPTNSLYMEALVGTHPLLEDFKLIHRALDVKKVQAEVRHAELENVRLAARDLKGEYGDPDIDKVVVVEGNKNVTVDAGR